MQIVGIMLVRNEDQFIGQAVMNVLDFCDKVIVADHQSKDNTAQVVNNLKADSTKIIYHRVEDSGYSHELIKKYIGSRTWLFGIDGDEIYDPVGLSKFRVRLESGEYDKEWQIFGNVLNCVSLDLGNKIATGHLAPPSRSMTKIYNFNALKSWDGECKEPLLGGQIIFKDSYDSSMQLSLHTQFSWENSFFRCLHTCFLRRSSLDKIGRGRNVYLRPNPVEINNRSPRDYLFAVFRYVLGRDTFISRWKSEKYMRGPLVETDVTVFFRSQVSM